MYLKGSIHCHSSGLFLFLKMELLSSAQSFGSCLLLEKFDTLLAITAPVIPITLTGRSSVQNQFFKCQMSFRHDKPQLFRSENPPALREPVFELHRTYCVALHILQQACQTRGPQSAATWHTRIFIFTVPFSSNTTSNILADY